jgi:acetyl esterase/lipase
MLQYRRICRDYLGNNMAYAKTLTTLVTVILLATMVACSPLTAINALSPGGASRETAGLSYGPDPRNRLDIYTPRESTAPAPVVVFFYGGNWTSGERADYAFVGRALASRGIVAVIADYRLYPAVHYPEILDDSARAVAWTLREAAQYGGDPRRVFVMGHSAGAYNAAMVALDDRWLAPYSVKPAALRGWIGLAGPYDFLPIENRTVRPVFFYPETPPDSQPANHVGANGPPALLIAARNDKLVDPVRNTGGLARRLRGAGVKVDEQYFDGVSHATLVASIAAPLRALAPTLDAITRFVLSDGDRLPAAPAVQQAAP